MDRLKEILKAAHILPELTELLGSAEGYLVGGALRDWILGRPVTDFDIAVPGDPTDLGRRFAAKIGGRWFMLDKARRQSRVLLRREEGSLTYDFAPFRAPGIEEDLRLRDFTVNAIALPLGPEPEILLDPLEGRRDLSFRTLKRCGPTAFEDDPLRILRGVRHCLLLGMDLEKSTMESMRGGVRLLKNVAGERMRSEIVLILASPQIEGALSLLHRLDLIEELFGASGDPTAFEKGAAIACRIEEGGGLLSEEKSLANLLQEEAGDGFTRLSLLKLAGFLRGYGGGLELLISRLRLSRRAGSVLRSLSVLQGEARQGVPAETRRGRALWVENLGPDPLERLLLLALLNGWNAESLHLLATDYLEHSRGGRIPDLVDGRWLRSTLGLTEGPAIGRALELLRKEEMEGRVRNLEDARKFLLLLDKKIVDK